MWRKFWSGIEPRLSPAASTAIPRQQTSLENCYRSDSCVALLAPRRGFGPCIHGRRRQLRYQRDTKVAEDDNGDDYKVTLAQQIFGRAAVISGRHPPELRTNDAPETKTPPVAARDSPVREVSPASPEPAETVAQQRQLKTAAELAELIESDLARHPDCPKRGFRVTVYGGSHWRAMLTMTPAAGPVRNPQEWRDLTNDLAERLRKRYDLAWE
jgi:hypothetical protein